MTVFFFSVFAYLIGMSSLAYLFWFLEFGDTYAPAFTAEALLINVFVFLIFPLQHSLMPREFVKKRFNEYVCRPVYVLASGVAMWTILLVWRPFGPILYENVLPWLFNIIFYASLVLIILSTVALNHSQMFGLYQGYTAWKDLPLPQPNLETNGIYGIVRHPLTSLLIIALWSHETLTLGRLIFNLLLSAYALIGTIFEERSLIAEMGEEYIEYKRKVPGFIPRFG
jgi:methanethiol S-methyltransferase